MMLILMQHKPIFEETITRVQEQPSYALLLLGKKAALPGSRKCIYRELLLPPPRALADALFLTPHLAFLDLSRPSKWLPSVLFYRLSSSRS